MEPSDVSGRKHTFSKPMNQSVEKKSQDDWTLTLTASQIFKYYERTHWIHIGNLLNIAVSRSDILSPQCDEERTAR